MASDETPAPRRWLWWGLRLAGTVGGVAYVALTVDLTQIPEAMARVGLATFALAMAVNLVNLGVGAVRWRILLDAYGAPFRPGLLRLYQVYLIGFFYNNFLPGAVGGDIVRGVITRQSFGASGMAASLTVTLVERILGLSGLLLLVTGTYLVHPIEADVQVVPLAVLGLAAAAGAVAAVALGRRLAPVLPGRLSEIAERLPALKRPGPFGLALALSLVTQSLVAVNGWLILRALEPATGLLDAFVIVPLAMAAAYFPFTVGGLGVREGFFAVLCGSALGMSTAEAVAASLLIWFSQLAVAALGGVLQVVSPVANDGANDGADVSPPEANG